MLYTVVFCLSLVAAVVNARFELEYPHARGPIKKDNLTDFCGGYPNAAPNRTPLDINAGVYTLVDDHPEDVDISIATGRNPTPSDFSLITNDNRTASVGNVTCPTIDFTSSNLNVTAGQELTIQFAYKENKKTYFQCADVILVNNATLSIDKCETSAAMSHFGAGSQVSLLLALAGLSGLLL